MEIETYRTNTIRSFVNGSSRIYDEDQGCYLTHTGPHIWQATVYPGFPVLRWMINGYRVNWPQYCGHMGLTESEILALEHETQVNQYRPQFRDRLNREAIEWGQRTHTAWLREISRQQRRRG